MCQQHNTGSESLANASKPILNPIQPLDQERRTQHVHTSPRAGVAQHAVHALGFEVVVLAG